MKKDVLIWINSLTVSKEDTVPIELYTKGSYYRKNGCYYISYSDNDDNGLRTGKSVIKVSDGNRVSVIRASSGPSMIIEEGTRNVCLYEIGGKEIYFGIDTEYVKNELSDSGGNLSLKYSLDVNSAPFNEVTINITVKEQGERISV